MLAISRVSLLVTLAIFGLSVTRAAPPQSCNPAQGAQACQNGFACSPGGLCGGPGATCQRNSYCASPYPCQDNHYGTSYCQNYDAATGSSPAQANQNNYGLFTVCSTSSDCGSISCGQARSNSTEPGVCGGTGASCSLYSHCATGVCAPSAGGTQPGGGSNPPPGGGSPSSSGSCIAWQSATLGLNAACTYSQQCRGSMVCVDDGTGHATCRQGTTQRARVCEEGISDSCSDDPNYSTCGAARSSSSETGVCGGSGVSCQNNAQCWAGTCNQQSRTCQYTATPQATTNIARRKNKPYCPAGLTHCAVGGKVRNPSARHSLTHQCIDIMSTLESCGGCIYDGQSGGQDCTAIDNAVDVSCVQGSCKISSCQRGWIPKRDGKSCVLATVIRDRYQHIL